MAKKKYRSIEKITHNGKPLREILEAHRIWVESEHKTGTRADLNGAKLSRADLSGAKLSRADLSGADLGGADLSGANLVRANLFEGDLSGARMVRTDLRGADLPQADLREAILFEGDLRMAKLVRSDLRGADLIVANLSEADLGGADLSGAYLGYTAIAGCDLSCVIGLETVEHLAPSSIGIDTIFRSRGKIPEPFLRGAGVPHIFIEYMGDLVGDAIVYYSCFLSHAGEDDEFVQALYKDLQDKGVLCWHYKDHAKWGKLVQADIGFSIARFDKTVVVCSKNSLNNSNVIDEIERAVQKESSEKKEVIFPIMLDDYVFGKWKNKEWEAAYKTRLTKYWVGDFTGWEDKDKYSESLRRLFDNLNRPPGERP